MTRTVSNSLFAPCVAVLMALAVTGLASTGSAWAATVNVRLGISSDKFVVQNLSDAASITRLSFDFAVGNTNLATPSYFLNATDTDLDPAGFSITGGLHSGPGDGFPLLVSFTTFAPDITFRDGWGVRSNVVEGNFDQFPLTMLIDLSTGDQIVVRSGFTGAGLTSPNGPSSIKGITYNLSYDFSFAEGTMPTTIPLPAAGGLLGGTLAFLWLTGWRRRRHPV